jgi:hypothetical protein
LYERAHVIRYFLARRLSAHFAARPGVDALRAAADRELAAYGPGPPGAVKRPRRFPQ